MTVYRRKGDWLTAKVGDQLVMMSVQQGRYVGLSEVGARIWEILESPKDIDQLCDLLVAEFDVAPDVCRAEVVAFLDELGKHDAVSLEP